MLALVGEQDLEVFEREVGGEGGGDGDAVFSESLRSLSLHRGFLGARKRRNVAVEEEEGWRGGGAGRVER